MMSSVYPLAWFPELLEFYTVSENQRLSDLDRAFKNDPKSADQEDSSPILRVCLDMSSLSVFRQLC